MSNGAAEDPEGTSPVDAPPPYPGSIDGRDICLRSSLSDLLHASIISEASTAARSTARSISSPNVLEPILRTPTSAQSELPSYDEVLLLHSTPTALNELGTETSTPVSIAHQHRTRSQPQLVLAQISPICCAMSQTQGSSPSGSPPSLLEYSYGDIETPTTRMRRRRLGEQSQRTSRRHRTTSAPLIVIEAVREEVIVASGEPNADTETEPEPRPHPMTQLDEAPNAETTAEEPSPNESSMETPVNQRAADEIAVEIVQEEGETREINGTTMDIPVPEVSSLDAQPIEIRCPHCHHVAQTVVAYKTSSLQWILCIIIALAGGILGCCLVPFCFDQLSDIEHSCPHCSKPLSKERLQSDTRIAPERAELL